MAHRPADRLSQVGLWFPFFEPDISVLEPACRVFARQLRAIKAGLNMEFDIQLLILVPKYFFSKDDSISESTRCLSGASIRAVLAQATTHAKSIPEVIFLLRFLFPVCQQSCSATRTEGGLLQDRAFIFSA